jgi:hypothetical protein
MTKGTIYTTINLDGEDIDVAIGYISTEMGDEDFSGTHWWIEEPPIDSTLFPTWLLVEIEEKIEIALSSQNSL